MNGFIEKWAAFTGDIATAHDDSFFLISHASYIMRTGRLLWAVDPILQPDEHEAVDGGLRDVFRNVRFVLTTHLHGDHFDRQFMNAVRDCGCVWIMPSFMTDDQRAGLPLNPDKVIYAAPGDKIDIGQAEIEVFESLHRDEHNGVQHGLDEHGYMITVDGRRFLFPGDVRNYPQAPHLPETDELFAHVWLGRQNALSVKHSDIDEYVRYFSAANASRIWLAHLNDHTRDISDMWTDEHAEAVAEAMRRVSPSSSVMIPGKFEKQLF